MSHFPGRIAAAAARFPDRTALERLGERGRETMSYAELMAEAGLVTAWLRHAEINPGDRVALLAGNEPRWVAAYLGILQRGAIAVPLDTAYSARQVAAILEDSDARLVFTSERYLDTTRTAAAACPEPPRVELLSTEPPSWSQPIPDLNVHAPGPEPGDDDAAVILYTSGTTADPKGVVLTHANLDAERAAVLAVLDAGETDVVLGVLPLFHALAQMANLWLPLSIGARVVFLDTVNSTTLLDALQTEEVTILACVPQFFYLIHQRVTGELSHRGPIVRRLVRAAVGLNRQLRDRLGWNPGRRVFARVHHALGPRMRLLITGGSRFDPAIARDLYGLGVSLLNGYGLTETSGAASIVGPRDHFNTSVGQPLPGVDVHIEPRIGPDAADGEVWIRGPIVMREYWRRPDATAAVLHDGWLHTGDLGRIDTAGRLHITGRLKDVIVLSSGKNLYPEEIEAHYRQSPFVKELCVLAASRPGEPAAERLHARVVPDEAVLRERGIVNLRELIRFELEGLSVQLPPHKRLLSYDIALEPLPRTTTGKLKRGEIERLVRERAVEQHEERALTPDERAWLDEPQHAALSATMARHLGRDRVAPGANLELDLGLDSMERVELLTAVEEAAGTRVSAETRATIFTVRQLVDAVMAGTAGDHRPAQDEAPDASRAWDVVLGAAPDPDLVAELQRSKFMRAFLIYGCLQVIALLLRVAWGLRVSGRQHLPDAPFIVCPNHQTFFDGFVIAAALPFRAFRRIFFVGAAEFFETPFMAWGARAINIVRLDPDANLVSAMRAADAGLNLGKVLILFPEGERTIDGEIKPFRKGAAILASHRNVPVVPAALEGLYPLWPRGRTMQWRALLPWRRRRVSVAFGSPLTVMGTDYASATMLLEQAVKATSTSPSGRTREGDKNIRSPEASSGGSR